MLRAVLSLRDPMAPDIALSQQASAEALTRVLPLSCSKPEALSWEKVVHRKRSERLAAIQLWDNVHKARSLPVSLNVKNWPIQSGELSTKEIEITETIPSRLLQRLATGEWTAEETLRAYIKRAVIAHYLVNPLTEISFESGIQRAKDLDQYLKDNGQPIGPFHGLPISLKDIINVKGHESTAGYVAWADRRAQSSDTIAQLLYRGGAVFYCKTNVPQGLMSGECFNYIFGRTVSPWNTSTSAGGSSGGEGALVAMGGSPIGIGTDIGGSINTPANFNGVYGLCPSHGRIPLHGPANTKSNLIVQAVSGPLSRSVDGLETLVRGVLDLAPWELDSDCVKMPWNQIEYERSVGLEHKLCFAFVPDDGIVTPHPPIQRGMRETKAALEAAGHYVLELPGFLEAQADSFELALTKIFNAQGPGTINVILEKYNEPWCSETIKPSEQDVLSLPEYFEAAKYISELRQKYVLKWMQTALISPTKRPVDAFILPSGGTVAPPHGTMDYLLYEAISNLLDWTCATIPVGFVDPELDPVDANTDFTPLSKQDKANHEKYNPEIYNHAPICLQVLGQRFSEEKVLGYLHAIDRALGRQTDYMS